MKRYTVDELETVKREPLLDYKVYEYNFEEPEFSFNAVRKTLALPASELSTIEAYDLMVPTKQRAWESLVFLQNCYSGGHKIAELAALYPAIVEYWRVYAHYSTVFKESDPSAPSSVAHIPLLGSEFVSANRLLSFGILLGHGGLLPVIAPILDYNNPVRDGLLERLLSGFTSGRGPAPGECTKHLPYFKTLKVFDAEPDRRSALMAEYLADWYEASRREPYFNSHKKGTSFLSYWAWEAAAITYLLDIDDTDFRDAKFYPADLVAFARDNKAPRSLHDVDSHPPEIRAKSGDICPTTGTWESLDIPPERQLYNEGQQIGGGNAAYGATVWRLLNS